MMKYLFTSMLIAVSASWIFAQDRNFYERMHGTNIPNSLLLRYDQDSALLYRCDESDWYRADGKLFNAANFNHDHTVNVLLEFANPLNFKLTQQFAEETDPSLEAVNDFVSKLGIKESNGMKALTLTSIVEVKLPSGEAASTASQSGYLSEWLFQLDLTRNSETLNYGKLTSKLLQIQLIENFLYNPIELGADQKKSVINSVAEATNDLIAATTYQDFLAKTDASLKLSALLRSKHKEAVEALESLYKYMLEDYDVNIRPFIDTSRADLFKAYTANVAVRMKRELAELMQDRSEALDAFEKTANECKTYCEKYSLIRMHGEEGYYRPVKTDVFKYDRESQSHYSFESKGKNGILKKTEFRIAKKLTLVPFASTGMMYTNFRYSSYSLMDKDTTSRIINESKTDPSLKVGAFLNLAIPMRHFGFYPFMQLGVSTDQSELIMPLGLGFILFNKFSLSAGTTLGYHDDLKTLKVGDIVTEEKFKSDLEKRVFGFDNWYFSLSYAIHQ